VTTARHQDNLAFESTTSGHRDSPSCGICY